jgi:hypothetical protein
MSAKEYAPDDGSDAPVANAKGEDSKALARLVDLVQEKIAAEPYARDGKLWCRDAYSLAPLLEVHPATLRRWFKANPTVFRLQPVMADGGRTTLVRLVEEGEPKYSPTQEAKYLAKIWESRVGRRHTRKEFGMLYHFAKACPPDTAGEVFKLVLKEWGAFMAIVKSLPEYDHFEAMVKMPTESEHGASGVRYYRFPRLPVIRAFAQTAVEFWLQELQWQGALYPDFKVDINDPKSVIKSCAFLTAPLLACKIIKLEDEVAE